MDRPLGVEPLPGDGHVGVVEAVVGVAHEAPVGEHHVVADGHLVGGGDHRADVQERAGPIRTRAPSEMVIQHVGLEQGVLPDRQPAVVERLEHVALDRVAHEPAAAQRVPVDAGAAPGQGVALVPAPLLPPQPGPRGEVVAHVRRLGARPCAPRRYAATGWRPRRAGFLAGVTSSRRYSPVCEPSVAATFSGVPLATRRPPSSPPSGPRSMIRSATLITSRLCSITTTVLPGVDQPLEHVEQPLDVGEVQAGGGLVEDVEGPAGGDLGQLGRQLDALRLATRQRRRRLAEPDVAQPHVVERLQAPADLRDVREELERLLDRHLEHVGDRLALEPDVEGLAVVALAVALLARHVDVGQEVHLDLDLPVAAADLAAPALDVEREAAGLVAARPRLLRLGEQLADLVEQPDVGGRVGPRRAPDRRLLDLDDLVELVQAGDAPVRPRPLLVRGAAGCRPPCRARR